MEEGKRTWGETVTQPAAGCTRTSTRSASTSVRPCARPSGARPSCGIAQLAPLELVEMVEGGSPRVSVLWFRVASMASLRANTPRCPAPSRPTVAGERPQRSVLYGVVAAANMPQSTAWPRVGAALSRSACSPPCCGQAPTHTPSDNDAVTRHVSKAAIVVGARAAGAPADGSQNRKWDSHWCHVPSLCQSTVAVP